MSRHKPTDVKLIKEGNITRPSPDFDLSMGQLESLCHHVGTCIAYLKDRCGDVDVPDIEISYRSGYINDPYAILINGNGQYRSYQEAWTYISHVFDGIEAVYRPRGKGPEIRFNIPVMVDFNYSDPRVIVGKGSMIHREKSSEIRITMFDRFPQELFDGMVAMAFVAIRNVPDGS